MSGYRWLEQIVQNYQGTITNKDFSACNFLVESAEGVMTALEQDIENDTDSRHAELDIRVQAVYTPNDPFFNESSLVYAPQHINAEGAWDVTVGDANLIVAVLDTGIDASDPEFSGRVLPGYDFVNGDADPADDSGHGTHVTGIIAAGIDNNEGIAGIAGNVRILPVKVLSAYNTGWWSDVAAGISWAVDQGADVINLSLTGGVDSETLRDAVNYALSKGVPIVVAAGNDGSNSLRYPASYEEVISLGDDP